MFNSVWPHGLQPARLLCPWDSPCKNTGVGCCDLLQRAFLTQGSNPCLLLLTCIGRQVRTFTERGREELPHVRGQGQKPGVPGCDGAGTAETSYPMPEVRGDGRECQAATAQGQPRGATPAQGQGRRPGGATPHPRSSGCAGPGGPRGAIPRSRSGEVAVRRYPSSKVRSSGCALLEQPWRDTPRPR